MVSKLLNKKDGGKTMVTIRVPATTANLGPGFDTLGMALDLYNYVEVMEIAEGLVIEVEGEGAATIPRDSNNIVYTAVTSTLDRCGYKPKGLKIRLKNQIPVARGMGSSAAALVGGIYAANCLAGFPLSEYEMLEIAAEIEGHPDNVVPALIGGLTVSTIEKNRLIYRRIAVPEELQVVVAIPQFPLSTEKSREILPKKVSIQDAVFNLGRSSLLLLAFMNRDYELLIHAMQDRLHQPYRMSLIPGMDDVFNAALEAGALGVALSGSGPTLIAFTKGSDFEIGQAMEQEFKKNNISCVIMSLKPNGRGTEVVAD